jgi:predicted TIM-barrel fold metal-dependent hydrolase
MKNLDSVGVDNVCFETDYPHTDTSWPDTVAVVQEMLEGVPDDIAYKVVRGNAIKMLGLDRV